MYLAGINCALITAIIDSYDTESHQRLGTDSGYANNYFVYGKDATFDLNNVQSIVTQQCYEEVKDTPAEKRTQDVK